MELLGLLVALTVSSWSRSWFGIPSFGVLGLLGYTPVVCGCFHKSGVLLVSALTTRALLFGVHRGAPNCSKLQDAYTTHKRAMPELWTDPVHPGSAMYTAESVGGMTTSDRTRLLSKALL